MSNISGIYIYLSYEEVDTVFCVSLMKLHR